MKTTSIAPLLIICLMAMLIMADASDYEFGTKVMPYDSDIGAPLFNLPVTPIICFWDIATSGYDSSDPVYLHISRTALVNANDVRLTSFGDLDAGTKVNCMDSDIGKPLNPLNVQIKYINKGSGPEYDLDDPVYISQVPSALSLINDIRLTHVVDMIPGTRLKDLDPDVTKAFGKKPAVLQSFLISATPRIKYFDVNGNNLYDSSDDLYLNYPPGQPFSCVAANNIRLSGPYM